MLLFVESLVCFGPIGIVLLLGIAVFPIWSTMGVYPGSTDPVMQAVGANPGPIDPPALSLKDYWSLTWPILAAIAAGIGFLGLFRWALALRVGHSSFAAKLRTLLMAGTGVAGWSIFLFLDPWGSQGGGPDSRPWDFVYPMVLVICGSVGIVGVLGMLVVLAQRHPGKTFALVSLAACTVGIAGLVLFFLPLIGAPLKDIVLFPFEAFPAFLVYFLLPAIGATHFLYLARRTVFPDLWSGLPAGS